MSLATASPALIFVALLGTCVWVGGFVAIVIVAGVARRHLPRPAQVSFFRALGRRYLVVEVPALALALAAGGALLTGRSWDATASAAVLLAAALVLALGAGVVQARGMTRLRRRQLASGGDRVLAERVRRGAMVARILRGLIGVLSLTLLALAAVLA